MAEAYSIQTGHFEFHELEKIDRFCGQFEDAWSNGETPTIETYVALVSGAAQSLLLRELLWIEWEYRRRQGDPPQLESYSARFPNMREVLETAWESDRRKIQQPVDTIRGDRYRILRPHARGGLGQVYVAADQQVGREVALKEVRQGFELNKEVQRRFLREAQITGRLKHPGIVPVFSVGSNEDGSLFYTMPLIDGHSLQFAIQEFHSKYATTKTARSKPSHSDTLGPPSLPEDSTNPFLDSFSDRPKSLPELGCSRLPARSYRSQDFRQLLSRLAYVCNVVQHAHENGVIHRDIKPSNVMLGRHEEVVVVDWGLAKVLPAESDFVTNNETENSLESSHCATKVADDEKTNGGTQLGTPGFMSPEQASARESVGPATDIYSLGASLFYLLTGSPTDTDQADNANGAMESPQELQPDVPPDLAAICTKALRCDPEERYPTASSLGQDIENWLADGVVSVYTPPVRARWGRWMRHHQTAVATSIVAVLFLAIAMAAITAITVVKNQDLKLARDEASAKQGLAEEERDAANSLSDFMVDLLQSPHPDADGYKLTVAEKLDVAFEKLKEDTGLHPKTRLRMLATCGESYYGLGLFDACRKVSDFTVALPAFKDLELDQQLAIRTIGIKALGEMGLRRAAAKQMQQVLDEAILEYGSSHKLVWATQAELAAQQIEMGQPEFALKTAEAALQYANRSLPENDPIRMSLTLESGRALNALDRYDEAIQAIESYISWSTTENGALHTGTLLARNLLGVVYRDAARHEDSIRTHRANFLNRKERLGVQHLHSLNAKENLATALLLAGQLDDAQAEFEETLAMRIKHLGVEHPSTTMTLAGIGEVHQQSGRFEEAVHYLKQAYEKQIEQKGKSTPDSIEIQRMYAYALMEFGKPGDALTLLEDLDQTVKELYGEELNGHSAQSLSSLATCYKRMGQLPKSLRIYEELIPKRTATLGSKHRSVIALRVNQATCLRSDRRNKAAARAFEEVLPDIRNELGDKHPWNAICERSLARIYLEMNRTEEAVQIYEGRDPEDILGWEHPVIVEWYVDKAFTYLQLQGRPELAVATFDKLLRGLKENCGPESVQYLRAKEYYAGYYEKLEEWDDAIRVAREVSHVFDRTLGKQNDHSVSALTTLSEIQFRAGDWQDAEATYLELVARMNNLERQNRPELGGQLVRLATCQLKQQEFAAAKQNITEALEIKRKHYPNSFDTINTEAILGDSLLGLGELKAAESTIVGAFEKLEREFDQVPRPHRKEVLRVAKLRISDLYKAIGDETKAQSFYERIDSLAVKSGTGRHARRRQRQPPAN